MSLEHPSPPSLDEDLRGFSKELRESWESLTARRAAGLVQTDQEELALDLDLAKRLCTALAGRPKQLWALAKESEVDVSACLALYLCLSASSRAATTPSPALCYHGWAHSHRAIPATSTRQWS